ncbi:MAG: KH domain-containing protein [Clostridia bacterium]|nr:KH domain-containing protein [Clostridia bacterium]
MPNSIISEGKTTNEAIENGLKKLKVTKSQVDIKVLESEDKRSFFSILAPRVVKVELTVKDNISNDSKHDNSANKEPVVKRELREVSFEDLEKAEENVRVFLDEISKLLGEEVTYNIVKNQYGLNVNMVGKDVGFLIGYRGDTLYSFQNILSTIASKGLEYRIRLILDIEGYKAKREKTLQDLAEKIAKTVVKTRRDVTLEPMQAYERKIIHSKLQDNKKVTTKSIGEEPRRRVVISLNKYE